MSSSDRASMGDDGDVGMRTPHPCINFEFEEASALAAALCSVQGEAFARGVAELECFYNNACKSNVAALKLQSTLPVVIVWDGQGDANHRFTVKIAGSPPDDIAFTSIAVCRPAYRLILSDLPNGALARHIKRLRTLCPDGLQLGPDCVRLLLDMDESATAQATRRRAVSYIHQYRLGEVVDERNWSRVPCAAVRHGGPPGSQEVLGIRSYAGTEMRIPPSIVIDMLVRAGGSLFGGVAFAKEAFTVAGFHAYYIGTALLTEGDRTVDEVDGLKIVVCVGPRADGPLTVPVTEEEARAVSRWLGRWRRQPASAHAPAGAPAPDGASPAAAVAARVDPMAQAPTDIEFKVKHELLDAAHDKWKGSRTKVPRAEVVERGLEKLVQAAAQSRGLGHVFREDRGCWVIQAGNPQTALAVRQEVDEKLRACWATAYCRAVFFDKETKGFTLERPKGLIRKSATAAAADTSTTTTTPNPTHLSSPAAAHHAGGAAPA